MCSPEKLSVFIKLVNNGTTTGVKHIIIMNMKEVRGRREGERGEGGREGREKETKSPTIAQYIPAGPLASIRQRVWVYVVYH